MAAEARPLFSKGPLPAPTTPAEQYLQLILGELSAIRELLVARGRPVAPDLTPTGGQVELREPQKPAKLRAKG